MKSKENGSVLLASLIIILLFTTIAMVAAKRSRVAEQSIGSNTRYKSVFEAAERSIRESVAILNDLKNKAVASAIINTNGENTAIARLSNLSFANFKAQHINPAKSDPNESFIWSRFALSQRLQNSNQLFNFTVNNQFVDAPYWGNLGIVSQYDNVNQIDPNNNLQNIQTYTFIEEIATSSNLASGTSALSGNGMPTNHFFRITVKASGFPPGTLRPSTAGTRPTVPNPRLATENAVVQMIFSTYF